MSQAASNYAKLCQTVSSCVKLCQAVSSVMKCYGFVDIVKLTQLWCQVMSTTMSSALSSPSSRSSPSAPLSTRSDSKEFLGAEWIPGHGTPRKATDGHGRPRKYWKRPRCVEHVQNVPFMHILCMCIEAERITWTAVLFREHGDWMWMSGDVKTSQAKEAKNCKVGCFTISEQI